MNKLFISILLSVIGLVTYSCESSNEDDLFGDCNPVNVSFSSDIQPILEASCTGCHSEGSGQGAGIVLTNYAGVKGQIDTDRFIESINWENGVTNMPLGASEKIDACEIETIQKWINEGIKDN